MPDSISNYRNMVDQPWGRMFYELIYRQLDISDDKRVKILDFGAGFCLTADHYAGCHDVTALEPNSEMLALRVKDNDYTLISKGAEYLDTVRDNTFDVVICHNVLEYVDDMSGILKQLKRVIKPGGILSIVKHNELGKVMGAAVLQDDPKLALDLLNKDRFQGGAFGRIGVYSNNYIEELLANDMDLKRTFGIRTFFGLSSNNEIKYSDEWYEAMLELEDKASDIDEYKKIAFFNHLIFEKRPTDFLI